MSLNIHLLEESFEKIKPKSTEFSETFHELLFEEHPELVSMFKDTDLEVQEQKLFISLALIVENLRNGDELHFALRSLGAYHTTFGTVAEQYPYIGQALIESFVIYLKDDWTKETENAWLEAYQIITDMMLEGAENPEKYLDGELTFYEWLDLYGEDDPVLHNLLEKINHFKYRKELEG
ncbi:MAG: globin domain-containing protein [Microcystaceae cyanobacterium]